MRVFASHQYACGSTTQHSLTFGQMRSEIQRPQQHASAPDRRTVAQNFPAVALTGDNVFDERRGHAEIPWQALASAVDSKYPQASER